MTTFASMRLAAAWLAAVSLGAVALAACNGLPPRPGAAAKAAVCPAVPSTARPTPLTADGHPTSTRYLEWRGAESERAGQRNAGGGGGPAA
jgi:hypothetical protein